MFKMKHAGVALVVLVLVLAACGQQEPHHRALPAGSTVLAFGDSVTFGIGAGRGEDYPTLLAEATGWKVINAGISGDTARNARHRLAELLQRYQPQLVIIELGGNDFLRRFPDSQVQADLLAMLQESLEVGAATVLVAVPRLSLLRAGMDALDDSPIYAELAETTGVHLVENVFSEVISNPELRADKVHPNAQGYIAFTAGLLASLRAAGLAQ